MCKVKEALSDTFQDAEDFCTGMDILESLGITPKRLGEAQRMFDKVLDSRMSNDL